MLHQEIRAVLRQLDEATHTRGGLLLVRRADDPWPVTWVWGGGNLFGVDGSRLTDEPTRWWSAVAGEDRDRLRELLEAERDDQVIEYRVRTPETGTRWIRESVRRVVAEGEGVFLVSVVRDVSAEHENERTRSTSAAGTLDVEASSGEGDLVLLVEDDEAVRSVLARVLAREGFPTLLAGTTAEALRAFERAPRPPAILVSDVVLPDRPGPELARALRRRNPDLPVLFISGYGADELERRTELDPGARLLPKPFTPADLVRSIRASLAVADRRRVGGGGAISSPQGAAS